MTGAEAAIIATTMIMVERVTALLVNSRIKQSLMNVQKKSFTNQGKKNTQVHTAKTGQALQAYPVKVKQHKPVQIAFVATQLRKVVMQAKVKIQALETQIPTHHVAFDVENNR